MPRIIELRWDCRECGSKGILGRHKRCPSCGASRESGEMRMDGLGAEDHDSAGRNKAASVTDSALLELARAGADWFCEHCDSGNRGDRSICASCGASRDDGEAARPVAATPPSSRPRPRDGLDVDDALEVAFWGGTSIVGVGVLSVLALVGLFLCLFGTLLSAAVWQAGTTEVPGTVTSVSWRHDTEVSSWTPVRQSDWQANISGSQPVAPVNGAGENDGEVLVPGSCRMKHHHDERYVCGSHQVCVDVFRDEVERYDCSRDETYDCGHDEEYVCDEDCRPLGNGFAECVDVMCTRRVPKTCTRHVDKTCSRTHKVFDHTACHDEPDYCTRPIEQPWCDYDTHRWVPSATLTARGEGVEDIHWKEPQLGAHDRVRRHASYSVAVAFEHRGQPRSHRFHPDSVDELRDWAHSDGVVVVVTNGGEVREVSTVSPAP